MSSTNRGAKRSEADFYVTPPYCIHRLLDAVSLPGGRWLEPCAGDGQIIRVVNSRRTSSDTQQSDIVWSAAELRDEMRPLLEPISPGGLRIGDFLGTTLADFGGQEFDVAITNPPFRLALPVIQKCMTMAKLTIMLLRVNFWGADTRQAFMEACPPDCYVIPNRPCFSLNKDGVPGSDSIEYMWAVWKSEQAYKTQPVEFGRIKVLKCTPTADRKEWTDHLRQLGRSTDL